MIPTSSPRMPIILLVQLRRTIFSLNLSISPFYRLTRYLNNPDLECICTSGSLQTSSKVIYSVITIYIVLLLSTLFIIFVDLQSIMLVEVTLTIFFYIFLSIVRDRASKVLDGKNPLAILMSSWKGQDKIFKFVQNAFCLMGGLMSSSGEYFIDNGSYFVKSNTQYLDSVAKLFAYCRKITRFPRTRDKIKSNKKLLYSILKMEYKNMRQMEEVFRLLGEIFDTIFFLGDHYVAISLMSIFVNMQISPQLQSWINFIWFLSSLSFLITDFFIAFRYLDIRSRRKRDKKNEDQSTELNQENLDKLLKFVLIDTFRNSLDTLSNMAASWKGIFAKDTLGVFGGSESLLWMLGTLTIPQYY